MRVIVDRIEGEFAVCELADGIMIKLVLTQLPADVKEGSVLDVEDDGTTVINKEAEEQRKKGLLKLQNELFGKKSCE
ncbi:MAG: DUF3006 domain-containing protein [Clostridiales bacterium]|nr:DUF3006 domain-containing protein [Clostridiales bacterium]